MDEKQPPQDALSSDKAGRQKASVSNDVEHNPYFSDKKPKGQLPEWLDHFNARDLKELLKCSIAAWVTTILIFINPTLRILGQAALFGPYDLCTAP